MAKDLAEEIEQIKAQEALKAKMSNEKSNYNSTISVDFIEGSPNIIS